MSNAKTRDAPADVDHTSWSALQTYAQCPQKYFYRYLERAPEERAPAALLFGTAFHTATERLHEARLLGRGLPSAEALTAIYEGAWGEQARARPQIVYGPSEGPLSLSDQARRMLAAYRQHLERPECCAREVLGIEEEARFRLLPDAPPIHARLDLIEREGDTLLLTDLKTARAAWNESKLREQVSQLVIYVEGLAPWARTLGVREVRARFVVLTKARQPRVQVLETPVGAPETARLKEQVQATWTAIRARAFPRREGWPCTSCPFRVRCLGR
ncbi:MAG: PD-(D/E)XK nuclease family protein [Planctomycetes bacterium]|nr:PD-(D/E)XK nuclease family protein [Planctomycetota bacterium]